MSNCQARWMVFLTSLNFIINHIPGNLNPADPVTCRPNFLPEDGIKETQRILTPELILGKLEYLLTTLVMKDPQKRLKIGILIFFSPPLREF
ncbi:hypothetical protein VP01_3724g2 [Puccinia sorghi]|uniref:Uncharacterized protein n=1 Tax=Puccinia sorghi TaxID=27349 RepID=A0A0L6UVY2_9BASI|nr:hypothetical protein VP01_3724g2 [Puccinia sorghi]